VTRVTGAAPGTIGTTLAAAPISNFDLEGDRDDNGVPGPHRFDLDTVMITTTATGGADQVEFGFRKAWLAAFGHPIMATRRRGEPSLVRLLTNVSGSAIHAVRQREFALDLRTHLGVARHVMRNARLGCCAVVASTLLIGACAGGGDGQQDCPQVELSADPSAIEPGEMTTEIAVVVSDPADENNPRPMVTTLTAESGTFNDPHAFETTFTCDPFAQGPVQVCVEARFLIDEEAEGCVQTECIDVECPQNLCPVIEEFQLVQDMTLPEANIRVVASDPDGRPLELVTTLDATSGYFKDPHASETVYMCSEFGVPTIELCVTASDGDEECDQTKCGEVNCNACPFLYSLSPIPSNIPPGENSSEIQVRAEDPDNYPGPLMLTLTASSGSFDDSQAFDTFFRCDGPGVVDVCAEVFDTLCKRSTCVKIRCP